MFEDIHDIKCSECGEIIGQIGLPGHPDEELRQLYRDCCMCSSGHVGAIELIDQDGS